MSGGTKTVKKVVTESDVAAAKAKLESVDTETVKAELKTKFDSKYYVITESFAVNVGEAESSPAVNAEAANGKATLKATTVYTLSAVAKSDVEKYITAIAKGKIENADNQKIYNTGISSANLSGFSGNSQSATAKLTATAKVGPQIDEEELKTKIYGKRFSEVQSVVEAIDGVNNVDVKFSPFWVNTVPSDSSKISIEFTVEN